MNKERINNEGNSLPFRGSHVCNCCRETKTLSDPLVFNVNHYNLHIENITVFFQTVIAASSQKKNMHVENAVKC